MLEMVRNGGRTRAAWLVAMMMTTAALAAFQMTAHAQTPVEAETRSFDIPVQPLPDALIQFGRQAGLQVSAEAALVQGLHSSPVQGSMTWQQALAMLLKGTGLTWRLNGSMVTVEPVGTTDGGSDNGAILLAPVRVGGSGGVPDSTADTYTVPASSTATKLDLSIRETPQVVNIMTRQRIEDQNLLQIADVLANSPGITLQQQGVPGAGRITFHSRGFPVTSVMLDGVLTTGAANRDFDLWGALDTAIYDRVELVQGSTGLGSGTGDPSASVNFVRKKPTKDLLAEAKLHYGTWNRARAEYDLSGSLDDTGSIRGRFVGAYQSGETWQDRVESEMGTLYGVVEADVADNLTLTAGLLWTDIRVDDAAPFGSAPASQICTWQGCTEPFSMATLGRDFNPATTWTFAEVELLNPFVKLEWNLDEDWRVTLNYMHSDMKATRLYGAVGQEYYNPGTDQASYTFGHLDLTGEIHNFDIAFNGKFELFGREHDLMVGFSGYWGRSQNPIFGFMSSGGQQIALSGWTPDYPTPKSVGPEIAPGVPWPFYEVLFSENGMNYNREEQLGGYIATRLRPSFWASVVLGVRFDRWTRSGEMWSRSLQDLDAWFTEVLTGNPQAELPGYVSDPLGNFEIEADFKPVPYVGVTIDVSEEISLYASYAGIRKANANFETGTWPRDINGDGMPPLEGDTIELGVKAALFDDQLNIQLAAYRMEQKNHSYQYISGGPGIPCWPNPLGGWCTWPQAPGNIVIAEGVDFSATGQITPEINIAFSYSWLQMSQKGDSVSTSNYCNSYHPTAPDSVNDIPSFRCPEHSVKVFATWQVLDSLTIGGGFTWKSETWSADDYDDPPEVLAAFNQGAVTVVDLMARYRPTPNLTISANVSNLFDETYLTYSEQGGYTSGGYYGAPRNVMVTLGYRF